MPSLSSPPARPPHPARHLAVRALVELHALGVLTPTGVLVACAVAALLGFVLVPLVVHVPPRVISVPR